MQCAHPLVSRSQSSWSRPPQKRNMPEPTSSVCRQQLDEEPRMSTSAAKVGIVLSPTKQNRMIPRFSFTRSEVRRSHCHRWGHQHADSPKSPVQRTYQAPRSARRRAAHGLYQDAHPSGQGDPGSIEVSRIVASRGVDLRRYRSKMLAYRMPMSPSVNTAMAAPI